MRRPDRFGSLTISRKAVKLDDYLVADNRQVTAFFLFLLLPR